MACRSPERPVPATSSAEDSVTFTIFNLESGGYGYDISVNGKVFIHQTNIPVLTGNKSFRSEDDAKKIATFVVEKIKSGNKLPAITLQDLQKLEINGDR